MASNRKPLVQLAIPLDTELDESGLEDRRVLRGHLLGKDLRPSVIARIYLSRSPVVRGGPSPIGSFGG